MLSQILQTLRGASQPLCAETLAQRMGKSAVVMTAMLDELALMGEVQVELGESECGLCQLKSLCSLPTQSVPLYRLTDDKRKARAATIEHRDETI